MIFDRSKLNTTEKSLKLKKDNFLNSIGKQDIMSLVQPQNETAESKSANSPKAKKKKKGVSERSKIKTVLVIFYNSKAKYRG